jgi:gamma-glutamyltranspeptidase/glutathione hydrolase
MLISNTSYIYVFLFIAILGAESCMVEKNHVYISDKEVFAEGGVVVSAHPLASETGKKILLEGGNAVDAAVAVHFALSVVYPNAGNLGGGGFMVGHVPGEGSFALDFRERAPLGAYKDMYLDESGDVMQNRSILGCLAAGVPGSVDGIWRAHQRYGRLAWARLVEDAIRYAGEGFAITELEATGLNKNREKFVQVNAQPIAFVKDSLWRAGDTLKQPELARTLERIRDGGRDEFYQGQTARLLADYMTRCDGLLTLEDLEVYTSVWRAPLIGAYRGYQVVGMPPPSSGGVALLQLLAMTDELDGVGGMHTAAYMHRAAEAARRVFADRAHFLGDPEYMDIVPELLLERLYLAERMSDFREEAVTPSSSVRAGVDLLVESEETTHFSIVDNRGMAVAVTTTINLDYGSKAVVPGAGFILNNEMDDFSLKAGAPNYFGLLGSEANAIQPGKRMLSSMTPTIVLEDDEVCLVIGSPGGSRIITTVFQVLASVLHFGNDLQTAVQGPRFHHQWMPDSLQVEAGFRPTLLDSLSNLGHTLIEIKDFGRVNAIRRLPDGRWHGVADRRGDDHAIGY